MNIKRRYIIKFLISKLSPKYFRSHYEKHMMYLLNKDDWEDAIEIMQLCFEQGTHFAVIGNKGKHYRIEWYGMITACNYKLNRSKYETN